MFNSLLLACMGVLLIHAQEVAELPILDVGGETSSSPAPHSYTKQLFPLNAADIVGFACAALGLLVAAGGGIGGGGILVPILILVNNLPAKVSIPLANVAILGGAVVNLIFNLNRRHPSAKRPLIDFDLALIMEPTTLIGANVGVITNKVLPPYIISIFLVILLMLTAWRTWLKWRTMRSFELGMSRQTVIHQPAVLCQSSDSDNEDQVELQSTGSTPNGAQDEDDTFPIAGVERDVPTADQLAEILAKESSTVYQLPKVGILLVLYGGVLVMTLMRGIEPSFNPLEITCPSREYFTLTFLPLAWLLLGSIVIRNHLVTSYHTKLECGFLFEPGDVLWNERNSIIYPGICTAAGLVAGMFGIGGGIVNGPLLLEMGVLPEVASATSAFMIFFTSASTTVQFIAFGQMTFDYAVIMLLLGVGSTILGQVVVDAMLKARRQPSLIVLIIVVVIVASAVLMGYQSILATIRSVGVTFTSICPSASAG